MMVLCAVNFLLLLYLFVYPDSAVLFKVRLSSLPPRPPLLLTCFALYWLCCVVSCCAVFSRCLCSQPVRCVGPSLCFATL
jgi:hypothetical protein